VRDIFDGAISMAYFSVCVALVYLASKRKDIPIQEVRVLFAAFIVCFVWHDSYFEGNLKGGRQ
jgi:hypothetical protein